MSEIANCTMQGRMSVFCPQNCKKCRLGVDNGPGLRYNNRRRREQHPGTPHGVCGRSSSGRAPPCQGGGSEFEPRRPLQHEAIVDAEMQRRWLFCVIGAPAKICEAKVCGEKEKIWYSSQKSCLQDFPMNDRIFDVVPPIGIEPMTRGFSVPCSTD